MRFDENAQLDTSNIDDLRGSGGGGGGGLGGRVAIGGGGLGIIGLILYFLLSALGGGGGSVALPSPSGLEAIPSGQTGDTSTAASACRTGSQANTQLDCEVVAVVNSLDNYWSDTFARSGQRYTPPRTVFFNGGVNTGCGGATSDTGPFYCPADKRVYIDLSFFDQLKTQFGATGGAFVNAYVLAHEYGHHVQDLLGIEKQVNHSASGASSDSVRLELQADCLAGVWANHATTVPAANGRPFIENLTQSDISAALDTAGRIGDDWIQSHLGSGGVDKSKFTHGSSTQRQKWFGTGYQGGDPGGCDTFSTSNLG
jgi:uncharacterized protein